ncbi:MAG TPA: alpha-glucan family phosphorylase [Burkholderiales bacterium]|nr:alpha-glucan family phosphorylase [Burkholderiales bacterium]
MPGTIYDLEVNPLLPQRLQRLEELAGNLWYSWDRPTRGLFSRVHPALWHAVGHSPKAFLKRVDQQRLLDAAQDPVYRGAYNYVLSAYDTYHQEPITPAHGLQQGDLVAYLCAEFGFHESLPIYSGGLGILAGDHCKSASDMRVPFVGVGLLYRQGYFHQTLDAEGRQQAIYADSDFDDLPISAVHRADGSDLVILLRLPGRDLHVKVWRAQIGHVLLYLLDTDVEQNSAHDRDITHRLYGGDRTTRIEQEIVLGVGAARALEELGLAPTVWHMNEGHAAFLVLERMRALVKSGIPFDAAVEAVAVNTVFTTHTAVPAGHDHFADDMIRDYFHDWCNDVGIPAERLLALGRVESRNDFNMTALAIRGSRHHNGVSRIHGAVSASICATLWPGIEPPENPVAYVTNGIHVPTFLATEWGELFDRYVGHGWSRHLTDPARWQCVHDMPDLPFWSAHQSLKAQMLHLVRYRVAERHARNQGSQSHLDRMLRLADPNNPNVLTIGFARRFATYKRATLIFQNLDWLRTLICNSQRPVLLIFAGKAHPADQPGQESIRRIAEIAAMPEFEGHVLLVENYDMQLARRLVSGVDLWLNNPVHPLEASGTSGMKAGINGVLNLSVLDGWWDEAFDGRNGWGIKPASSLLDEQRRDQEESRTLYEILQDKVIPLYYARGAMGYSPGWVEMAKHSIATLLPRYNSLRMLEEYADRFYAAAARQWRTYSADGHRAARNVAAWKAKVRAAWDRVHLARIDDAPRRMPYGGSLELAVAVELGGLDPADVAVEVLFGRPGAWYGERVRNLRMEHVGAEAGGTAHRYRLNLTPDLCGKLEYRIRAYPHHGLLTHPFEMGLMKWL